MFQPRVSMVVCVDIERSIICVLCSVQKFEHEHVIMFNDEISVFLEYCNSITIC